MQKFKFPISFILLTLCGCGANGVTSEAFGKENGNSTELTNENSSVSWYSSKNRGASPCSVKDENNFCLGLKYIAYKNSNGRPVISADQAKENVTSINQIWSQCKITFKIDSFESVDPDEYSLKYNTSDSIELNDIRKTFDDQSHLLVVTIGKWDRSGTLGNTGANAWTSMPGESMMGVVMESTVATFSNIIAHELGHYLNLDHMKDKSDLMNPIIYDSSTSLNLSQCQQARLAVETYWQHMLR